MELAPTIFSAGWAAGVNSYATVALLGILGKAGVGDVPQPLTRNPVIGVALVMFAVEFIADKIPYLDTTWDLVHTAIRPAVGSVLGVEFADLDQADAVLGGLGGGTTALASHAVKAGVRLGINTSPEPVTNIVASLLEDLAASVVVVLLLEHPLLAASIAGILLVAGMLAVIALASAIRRAARVWRAHRAHGS
jgi:hypothetical protein